MLKIGTVGKVKSESKNRNTKGQSLSSLYYNPYNYVLGAMQSHNDENPGQPIATANRTTTD